MSETRVRIAQAGDETGIARVQIDAWAQTYDGILPDKLLRPWDGKSLTGIWHKRISDPVARAQTFVAEGRNGRLVGFGICSRKRGQVLPTSGEIALLYLLRSAQGQGTGRTLMRALARASAERGRHSIGAWVLAENENAIGFYECLGGIRAVERNGNFGGYRTHEIGFIWPTGLLSCTGELKGTRVDP